jgi:uncharacterized membrane protein YbhN (UPF0104 family)
VPQSTVPAGPGPLRRSRDWLERHPLVVLVVPTVLALGAVALLADLAGAEPLNRALRNLHPAWLLLCLGGELVAYFGYVLAVATRTSGGFAVDYWVLRSAGEDRDGAVARVFALGALEYAVLAPAALVSAIALLASGADVSKTLTLPWLLVIPGAFVAIWVSSPKRAARWSKPRGGRLRHAFAHFVAGLSILRSMFVAPPREHGLGLLGTALYWAGDIACLWGALQVFGNPRLSLPALILGYATGYVLTRRSLPAGGAGVVEIALTFALHWMGFPFVRALLGVVVYRIFNLWLPILPALATLPAVKELRRELKEAEEA